jgi:hypothetical protein
LFLDKEDAGNPGLPLEIGTYGKGEAIIEAGTAHGILIKNTGGVRIRNLRIEGSGVGSNTASGIECLVDEEGLYPAGIEIVKCSATGFHRYGIVFLSDKTSQCGFRDVKIVRCQATANGESGIASLSYYPSISHRNFYVGHCKAYENRGILTKTDNHSGNGIVMGGVEGLRIEHCEAWENGADCRSLGGGPVGIWVWCCRNATIEHCSSHHNHAGLKYDGGGFDIDGGSADCIIRNCLSYENEGAGYLICEFGSPFFYTNNLVENCISRNDGRKNSYGAITISAPTPSYRVNNTILRNNKIFINDENVVNGTPTALYFYAGHFRNILMEGNTFEVTGQANVLRCDTLLVPTHVLFKGNNFKVIPDTFRVSCSLQDAPDAETWRALLESK